MLSRYTSAVPAACCVSTLAVTNGVRPAVCVFIIMSREIILPYIVADDPIQIVVNDSGLGLGSRIL